jgi:aryl-alcohol dehydrogenase-like predicted oxidoreductase
MEMRNLGRTQIRVAPLAFGGNVFGWTVDERSAFTLLDKFTDAGFNLVDTADVYSRWVPGHLGGESETIIGRWLKHGGRRDAVVIATKVGMEMGPGQKGLSGKYIREAVEGSLRRLQTDYIDLYQSHEDDPSTPMEETLATYADLVKEGKIRAIGASNFSAERLLQALETSGQHGYPRYETLQPLYNLYERAEFESKLEPVCREHQLGVLCYYALASGFLTGKYRSERDLAQSPRGQGVKKYMNARGMRILAALDQVAQRCQATPAQVALAWLIARPSVTAPIASATSPAQLQDLMAAVDLKLDQEAMALLDQASAWSAEEGRQAEE